ncbi:hypothetical protein ACLGIH_32830 [Streptomyces sp. HMX87]
MTTQTDPVTVAPARGRRGRGRLIEGRGRSLEWATACPPPRHEGGRP